MAKQIIERLIDDLDGGDAEETVTFALDGVNYTIDLSTKNASKLRELFAPYQSAGTRLGRGAGTWRPGLAPKQGRNSRADNAAIREWATKNGHELAERGRIPVHIVEAYETAKAAPGKAPAAEVKAPVKATRRSGKRAAAAVA
ncbi:histone-like nucleoid-structuring protein Lsr2 [Paractinoplanes rishiriensis]|uniref:Nucleoid-associated protein Lsr2 n=1 Tax=Paractinoplanes rishiriensis TaxID=1050105 RepID=A0A919JUV3_9ACTN|nr:Lsr2 family protein [Actinoplanes rishiriensis]GIE94060.1 nucleoid-associated protein Lsr2 [Actinoplanes rishiriensis]